VRRANNACACTCACVCVCGNLTVGRCCWSLPCCLVVVVDGSRREKPEIRSVAGRGMSCVSKRSMGSRVHKRDENCLARQSLVDGTGS
jgi:hypothetical protein